MTYYPSNGSKHLVKSDVYLYALESFFVLYSVFLTVGSKSMRPLRDYKSFVLEAH